MLSEKPDKKLLGECDKAVNCNPGDWGAWLRRGLALWSLQRYPEAIASYDNAIRLKPNYDVAWMYRGHLLRLLQHYPEAIASYDKAIQIIPHHREAWACRGHVLMQLQQYHEAIAAYDKVLQIRVDAGAWYCQGDALMQLKRYSDAVISYSRAVQFNPIIYKGWSERVQKLRQLPRPQEAFNLCYCVGTALESKAAKVQPSDRFAWNSIHQAWHELGNCLYSLHRYAEAVAIYNKAIQIKPNDSDSWCYQGYALEQLQRYQEAIKCYEMAIGTKPDYREAIAGKKRLYNKFK